MDSKPPRTPQGVGFWVMLAILGAFAIMLFQKGPSNRPFSKRLTTTELYSEIDKGNVQEIVLVRQSGEVEGKFTTKPATSFTSNVADVGELEKHAIAKGVPLIVKDLASDGWSLFLGIAISLLPWIFIIVFMVIIFRSIRNNMNSHNNQFSGHFNVKRDITTRFSDLAGCDEVVEEAKDIVEFLAHPEVYREAEVEVPKGLLLEGAPGVGKTLLARAIAGEAGVEFIAVSGSDFVETFVGVGARRIRDLFVAARKHLPCIIFIDEVDAVGKKRSMSVNSHLEHEQTLTALLAEMDGFDETDSLLVIGATNEPNVLDPALLRRFSRKIEMPYPDTKGREAILKIHARKKKLADDVNFSELAKMTSGFSGDDLKNLTQEASRTAVGRLIKSLPLNTDAVKRLGSALRGKFLVTRGDFFEAFETSTLGRARKSRVVPKHDREITAYHEAGHALAIIYALDTEPLGKVTIVPRGSAGGFTTQVPEDHLFLSREQLFARLIVCMGGRAAEMNKFKRQSTGASGDFQKATALSIAIVAKYGMNNKVGKMVYLDEHQYLKGVGQLNCSSEMRLIIEEESKNLIDEAYAATEDLIREHQDDLETLGRTLLEKETMDASEIYKLLKVKPRK